MSVRMTALSPMLKTEDLEATIAFYTDILGFSIDAEDEAYCALVRGPVQIMFYVDEEGEEPAPALTGQIYLEVDNLSELFAELEEDAEVLYGPEEDEDGAQEFAIRDPNGYVLTFSEPADSMPDDEDFEDAVEDDELFDDEDEELEADTD